MLRRVAVAALLFAACPPQKPPYTEPEPTGRCEVDLEAIGLFSNIGTGVKARTIAGSADLIGGTFAQARTGDVLLENDRIRVVIQQPGHFIAPLPYGGSIIDADLQRSTGGGRDQFGKLGLIYGFGRTINVNKVEILNDGTRGGYAVVAASGTDALVDYVNVQAVISRYLGDVKLVRSPELALPLRMSTYYVLSPGESRVRVLTAFCNEGKETISTLVGDMIDSGALSEPFNPQGCTNGLGARDCLIDSMPWMGFQADGVAYGYRTAKLADAKSPGLSAVMHQASAAIVMADGESQSGLLTWVDENAARRPGTFGILSGDKRTFLRDFFVGKDIAEISSTMLALDGSAKSKFTATVKHADGTAAPGARVTIRAAESGKMQTLLVADAQGVAKADVKPGNYLVGSTAMGSALVTLTPVSVPSNGEATLTLTQGETHTLNVTITDPFRRPLTGKVTVRCTNPPCANQLRDYRPWFDVEDHPSDVQSINHAGSDGRARIALPSGQYEVFVTRGPEYSTYPDTFPTRGVPVDLRTADATVDATLAQVIDSTGWMSADLHVHAMGSPDSAVGNSARALSFAAEGIDVLVSTDHDFITDYAPVLRELQLDSSMASMIGCEVTPFDFGHHNNFPVTKRDGPNGGAFDWAGGDGPTLRLDQLYAGLRNQEPNAIIQMNHPRSIPGGALAQMRIDTATGASHATAEEFRMEPNPAATATDTKLFDPTFDALEVMNGTTPSVSVLNDWMTFTSRGWLKVGTGVSDSHQLFQVVGGYGRTWLQLGVDAPSAFTGTGFTQAMKQRRASFSNGPFITMTARALDGTGQPTGTTFTLGDTVSIASGGSTELTVDVQAPEWMQFDAVEVHTHVMGRESFNGVPNTTFRPAQAALHKSYDPTSLPLEAVPGLNGFSARRVHVREKFVVTASSDTWFVAMVRGSSAARPISSLAWDWVNCTNGICEANPSRVWGVTNAILVDADGSGAYDDFPLKPGNPLTVAPAPQEAKPPRVPTEAEVEEMLRALKRP